MSNPRPILALALLLWLPGRLPAAAAAAALSLTASDRVEMLPNLLKGPSASAQVTVYSPGGGTVRLRILRQGGRTLRSLWSGRMAAKALRSLAWDGKDDAGQPAASGIYEVVFEDGDGTRQMKRVLVLR
ncbi:MAG TPA: FlgD immunoglobulin-like domain containing protein [bacterium]|jgi:hypothetical protein|nr:FlgD immunoglobulin-like domain containing protein [bacterium]